MKLSGRRILVTGAASGIANAISRRFVTEGATVFLADRQEDLLKRVAADLNMPSCFMDVCDEAGVQDCVANAVATMGGLDGLVNAAGVTQVEKLVDTTTDVWDRMFDVNLRGAFLVSRTAMPHLACSAHSFVVNIASVSGLLPGFGGAAYGSAKAGLIMLTKSLAAEGAPNIRANVICPGTIDTPLVRKLVGDEWEERKAEFSGRTLVNRMGTPEDIAAAAAYLASSEASFVNGITLAVDGGRTFH